MTNLFRGNMVPTSNYKVAYNDENDIPCSIMISAHTITGAVTTAKRLRKGSKFRAVRLRDSEYSTYLETKC